MLRGLLIHKIEHKVNKKMTTTISERGVVIKQTVSKKEQDVDDRDIQIPAFISKWQKQKKAMKGGDISGSQGSMR
jgi:hypothetical protein